MSVPTYTPVTPPPGQPGRLLSLHAIGLRCLDETEHDGLGEGVANDAIRLFALNTMQTGTGVPVQSKTAVFNLGDNYEDGRFVDFDIDLASVWIPAASPYPVKLNVLLTLGEEDWGGQNWDQATKDFIDEVGKGASNALSQIATTAVSGVIGSAAGPVGPAVGSLVGAVVRRLVDELTRATKKLESDLFPPSDVTVILDRSTSVLHGPDPRRLTQTLLFEDFGGRYELVCQWRIYEQAASPTAPTINRLRFDILTGSDDLRGGNDNLNLLVELVNGHVLRQDNVNRSARWADHQRHEVIMPLAPAVRPTEIKAVTLETTARGGMGGDNWNVDAVTVTSDRGPILTTRSGAPLHRFTGDSWQLRLQIR